MSQIFKIMRGLINVIYPSLLTLDKKCTDFWRMYSAWSPIYVFAFVFAKKECYHSAQSVVKVLLHIATLKKKGTYHSVLFFRIGVDEWLRVPSVPDVFSVGDCCGYLESTGKHVLPSLAQASS